MELANVDMANAWDGEEGEDWVEHAEIYENAGPGQWERVVATGVLVPGADVLDIGCGTGRQSLEAARLVAPGRVLGVDLSSRMLEYARKRAANEGVTNLEYLQADAQVHRFDAGAFDAAISTYGAMFFNDARAAFTNVATALRPGGQLVVLTWRDLGSNAWLQQIRAAFAAGRDLPAPPPGAPGPFGLAEEGHVRDVLGAAGFTDVALEAVDSPIRLGARVDDAYAMMSTGGLARGLTHGLGEATKAEVFDKLRQLLASHETPDGVLLDSASWLITAVRP